MLSRQAYGKRVVRNGNGEKAKVGWQLLPTDSKAKVPCTVDATPEIEPI